MLVLLAVLVGSTGCSGQRFPDPVPPMPADLDNLTLAPYRNEYQGLEGVVPEGWFEAIPEFAIFLSGPPETRPGTTLIVRLERDTTAGETLKGWLPLLGLQARPQQTGQRRTPDLVWDLYAYEVDDPDMGPRKGTIALAEAGDEVYMVVLIAIPEQYEALREAVLLPAVDALAPARDPPSRYQAYADWPVVAAIEGVGNSAREEVEFALQGCTPLRVYAVGEGSEQGMADYGYVEDVATGQIVWQMYHFETDSAGYARNRRADRLLTLPAGTYRLHFESNDTHAYGDWEDQPPGHRFWGITLFRDESAEADQATCWERAARPEDLGWSSAELENLDLELRRLGVAALMVVTDGQVVFEWGKTANIFLSHSMRKSLLSALYGIHVSRGEIELSNTLEELGIDDLYPLTKGEKQATVGDLLRARSGVYIPAAAEAQSMRDSRPSRGSHRAGTHWYYNNWDFNVLGTIFRQETGEDLYQAFGKEIAVPLGMQDWRLEEQHYVYEYWLSEHPAYPFRISARDLARVGQLALQRGEWQGRQILPAGWVEESTQVHSETGQGGTYSGYGYMWWIAAKDHDAIKAGSFAASGYGGHTLEILPHLNTVIAVRVNTDDPVFRPVGASAIDDLILKILAAREEH